MTDQQQTIFAECIVRHGHDFYWQRIMALDTEGVWAASNIWCPGAGYKSVVSEFIRRLVVAGIAEEIKLAGAKPKFTEKYFRLLSKQAATPRVRRDGKILPEKRNDTLWRTIKMLKNFTVSELTDAASLDGRPLNKGSAKSYVRHLTSSSVLIVISEGSPGIEARYRLLRNLGAAAPQILRSKMVFDPNANKILGVSIAEEVSL